MPRVTLPRIDGLNRFQMGSVPYRFIPVRRSQISTLPFISESLATLLRVPLRRLLRRIKAGIALVEDTLLSMSEATNMAQRWL